MKREIIESVFKNILENTTYDESLIDKSFSKDYIQKVDGKMLDLDGFKKHILKLKEKVVFQKVEIENFAENEDSIFTKHIVISQLNTGEVVKHKVFAEFCFVGDKIKSCDELTMLLSGNEMAKNLGSEM